LRQPLLATALLLSCAIAPKPTADPPAPPAAAQEPSPAQAAAADLALLRTDVESLLRAQAEILWRSWITGEPAGLERASASRARVLAPASLALVKRSLASAQGGELRALQLLHAYLVGEHLAAATAPSADRLAAARAAASVVWDGRQEPLRRVTTLLAGEAEAGRRAALEKLQRAGHLLPIYMVLASLSNFRSLIDRRSRKLGQ